MTLRQMRPGERGTVRRLRMGRDDGMRRLAEMGVRVGARILVRRVGPFGDPMLVELCGYTLALRREDADCIEMAADKGQGQRHGQETKRPMRREGKSTVRIQTAQQDVRMPVGRSSARGGDCGRCHACGGKGARPRPPYAPARRERPLLVLAGNPNAGKTTLFNALTGAHARVGNHPGVTVDADAGLLHRGGAMVDVLDVPGTYSLLARSGEERIAAACLLESAPDAVIDVVDATNLQRNLFLTLQLCELDVPVVVALTMVDEAERRGLRVDTAALSARLGVPVTAVQASAGRGLDKLVQTALDAAREGRSPGDALPYPAAERRMRARMEALTADACRRLRLPNRYVAACLLGGAGDGLPRTAATEALAAEYAAGDGSGDGGVRMAGARYAAIEAVLADTAALAGGIRAPRRDRIDNLLLHRVLGLPLLLLLVGGVLLLTFGSVGGYLSDGVERLLTGWLLPGAGRLLTLLCAPAWLRGLLCDGVLTGIGSVLMFLPQIALLFFLLSLLEDAGYLARAAFLTDGLLRRIGLSGKSFVPVMLGFGCTVPAALSTRTMDTARVRRMTLLLLPFVSCSARLPVYGMVASAFFPGARGAVIVSLYLLGLLCGALSCRVWRGALFPGAEAPFLLELPPYRLPKLKNTLSHVAGRVRHFTEKAGSVILVMSAMMWFLTRFDPGLQATGELGQSLLGRFGAWIQPLFRPLGFSDWRTAVALLSGLIAKESVVSTMALLSGGQAGAAMAAFTPLSAYVLLVFVLLYTPCVAALACLRRELGSRRLTAFLLVYQPLTAYATAYLVYRLGLLLGR